MKLTRKQLRKMIAESIKAFNTPYGSFGIDPNKEVKLSRDADGDYTYQLPGDSPKKVGNGIDSWDDENVCDELVRLKMRGYTHVDDGDFMGPRPIEEFIEEFDGLEGKYKAFYPKSSPDFEPIGETPSTSPAKSHGMISRPGSGIDKNDHPPLY